MTSRILIADGEERPREALCWYLRKEGYRVCTAEDSFEALGLLLNGAVSMALLDADLPPGGGLELAQKMEEEETLRFVPVVILARDSGPARLRPDLIVTPKGGEFPRLLETVRVLTGGPPPPTPQPRLRTPTPVPTLAPYRVQLVDHAGPRFRALPAGEQAIVRVAIERLAALPLTISSTANPGNIEIEDVAGYQIVYAVDHQNRRLVVRDVLCPPA